MGFISVALKIWLEREVSNSVEINENDEIFVFLADGSKAKIQIAKVA